MSTDDIHPPRRGGRPRLGSAARASRDWGAQALSRLRDATASTWPRRAYALIVGVAVIAFTILSVGDYFEVVSRQHDRLARWWLDELFNLCVVATPALAASFFVYVRTLHEEIERRKRAEEQASTLANYDSLTGLANRRLFHEEFSARLETAKASGLTVAVLMLDLDRFKSINDLYGHSTGDRLLQAMADRLRTAVREQDFVARLGGDEFAILTDGGVDDTSRLRLVQRLLADVQGPITIGSTRLTITTSIGVAAGPQDGDTPEILLQRADQAMYQAKAAGRNRHSFFDPAQDGAFRERLILEAELHDALDGGEIVPYYQPLINLASQRIVGFEALARWHHPTRGILAGALFVPLAEETGLIAALFEVILRQACHDAVRWHPSLLVAVNVSPTQFSDRDLVTKVLTTLQDTGLDPHRLELEITETALVQDFAAAKEVIEQLKARGVRVALDDFGTGYSSLRHLHELSLDKIKIDRSFVANRKQADGSETVVASIIALGHSLGMEVMGEGIEQREDAVWLTQRGCDQGQGYLFSKPVPAEAVAPLLDMPKQEIA